MPGIEIKGRSKIANYRHGGRIGLQKGGRGSVTSEGGFSFPEGHAASVQRRGAVTQEGFPKPWIGKKKGGRAGYAHGMSAVKKAIKKISSPPGVFKPKDFKGKGSDKIRSLLKGKKTHGKDVPTMAAEGGRIGFKKGTDKKWIQKAVDPKHKGYCTPMTKKTCTPARKALARTFKKKAKTGWG